MKRLLMTLALTSMLFASAMAGDIPTGESPAPGVTPRTSSNPNTSAAGDMSTGDAVQPTLDDALSALLSALGLVL